MRFNQYQCELWIIQLAPDPSSLAWTSGSVGPKPGSLGPIGQNEIPVGKTKRYTAGPVPTPLPSAKSGRPPPTLAKNSSPAPPTGLGGVKTLECEQLKTTGFFVKHTTKELEIAQYRLQQNSVRLQEN
eukprot:scaffold8469_cov112-Isochrysis_galbana.AAC.3